MTDADKIAAFDVIAKAMAHQWSDGSWSWFCMTPCGGPKRDTPQETVKDFLQWCGRIAAKKPSACANVLPVVSAV